MGFFSFGSKGNERRTANGAYDVRAGRSDKAAAAREKAQPREKRSARNAGQEALLDPLLLEKRRARSRLLGAVVLVAVAIVILSKVLEPGPRPPIDDIAIHVAAPAKMTPASALNPEKSLSVPDKPATPFAAQKSIPNTNNLAAKAPSALPSVTPSQPVQPTRKPAPLSTATNLPSLATAPSTQANPRIKTNPQMAAKGASALPNNRFAVQLGALNDEPRARAWAERLKAANIPAYLERKKLPNGSQQFFVRAGPFNDRASAEAASKRIRELGLAQMNLKTTKQTAK
ncbi:SPOR domain-containing protein [Mycoavidus sp. B2-EB]|uniref:SPOR domain-containing protein n=1 Tax=Mycoavidus sp. B2-EB TaxID=2651972 RepID=UPI00162AA8E8|nr:SPOR domain-containing protein [Mycoavidus sp. B2-EB]BBO60115.1 hypothetical protein MPB2EB_1254 [Mycoavidus sp. B2-EB]